MHESTDYHPDDLWIWKGPEDGNGGTWAKINAPTAGARFERDMPTGKHPFQLYSLATPNGQKVTIMFEELLNAGYAKAEYDAHLIRIAEQDQFSSGFVAVNPNAKIPALIDVSGDNPIRVFESGAILLHLAEKFGEFLPTCPEARAETLSWLFWQMGSGGYLGGGFGHFYKYAPRKFEYAIDRYTMEVKRQLDLLNQQLESYRFISGNQYTIADIAIWPWYGNLILGALYDAAAFLDASSYRNVRRWAEEIFKRPAVQRGRMVNRISGPLEEQLHERHEPSDFDLKTADKLAKMT